MKQLLLGMLLKQNELNILTIGQDWKERKDINFYRAIWVETAELMECFNWKWWKEQRTDYTNAVMELTDIWHFGMSQALPVNNAEGYAEWLERFLTNPDTNLDGLPYTTVELLDRLAAKAAGGVFSVQTFFEVCHRLDFSVQDLYKLYMGKYVLNEFRQEHGYKEGLYVKNWANQGEGKTEDNAYLQSIVATMDAEQSEFAENLYALLEQKYSQILVAQPEMRKKVNGSAPDSWSHLKGSAEGKKD